MTHRRPGRTALVFLILSALVPVAAAMPPAAQAADPTPAAAPCAGLTGQEENHASIRLRVDEPAEAARAAVDEQGRIALDGILHKHASMLDVTDESVTTSDFTIGEPPAGVAAWASSWAASLRPPHLGENQVCVRAERDPKRTARILRSFTVVDLIPPSNVPGLAVGSITPTSAKVTWGAATDNYGLAGYDVRIDGGAAHRTTVGNRSYTVTGLAPSSSHTVSVVAVDLAGNRSETPATTSFTTAAEPTPTDPSTGLALDVEQGGATAAWHPVVPAEASYRVLLGEELLAEFPPAQYCVDADGNPADPCTAQDVVRFPIGHLEEGTAYSVAVQAVGADGAVARTLTASFTTTAAPRLVPQDTVQLVASETSRCAGMGGDLYVARDGAPAVPVPAGSTLLFDGCYKVPDSGCVRTFWPPTAGKLISCADDITRLVRAVAPSGGGPVIASVSDVVTSTPTKIEPVTWCTDGACLALLAPPVLVKELAPVVVEGAAGLTVLGVLAAIAGGIVVGLVVGTLWTILSPPTPIGILGLLEYPIDWDTNFETFDNWLADEGEWFNSLKVYAQVIESTNDLAGWHNIPFAWTNAFDGQLRRIIDAACTAQRGTQGAAGCDDDIAVYVPGGKNYLFAPMPETGRHIVAAMGNGSYPQPPARSVWFAPDRSKNGQAARAKGYSRGWFDTVRFRPNTCTGRVAKTCDEFPFWTTNQAVDLSGMVADLLPVPVAESTPQGTDISGFYNLCDVDDNDQFIVLPLKPWVDVDGPSFGFRVNQGSSTVCMAPRP